MSMYIRIKREKLTIFLHVEPTDTVGQVKSKLEELIQQAPANQSLHRYTDADKSRLDDSRTLAELGIATDDVLALTLKQEDGSFEEVNVAQPEDAAAEGEG